MNDANERKQRKIERTKEAIKNIAIKEFSKNGFSKTKMSTIAYNSDLATGTLYNYFQSKEELYISCMESFIKRNSHLTQENNNLNSLEDFLNYFIINIFSRNSEASDAEINFMISALPDVLSSPELSEFFYSKIVIPYINIIEKTLSKKDLSKNLDSNMTSKILYSTLVGSAILNYLGDNELNGNEYIKHFTHIFSNGIQ